MFRISHHSVRGYVVWKDLRFNRKCVLDIIPIEFWKKIFFQIIPFSPP